MFNFVVFIFVIFFHLFTIIGEAAAPCSCFTGKSVKYSSIQTSYKQYDALRRGYLLHHVGTGYPKYEWENGYYHAQKKLLLGYVHNPLWFADYHKNLLLDDALVDICRNYKLEYYERYYRQKPNDPNYLRDVNSIHERVAICHRAFTNHLQEIIEAFGEVFRKCPHKNASARTLYDYGLYELLRGNYSEALDLILKTIDLATERGELDLLASEAYQHLGVACFEAMSFEKAVEAFSKAIEKDPNNKGLFFYRASSYFELGQFDLALNDYANSDRFQQSDNFLTVTAEFAASLIAGVTSGAKEAAVEFVPSLLSTTYGLGIALWSLVENPIDSTVDFINACYEVGECAVDFCKTFDQDQIVEMVEEVKHLYETFDVLSEGEKGHLIGYSIGKYGVDIFAGATSIKAVSALKKLKEANRFCNLESMVLSDTAKETIRIEALEHAAKRKKYLKNTKIFTDQQNKHIPGKHNYIPGKSILEHPKPQKLLNKFAGSGRALNGEIPGTPNYREMVDFKEHIGIWKNDKGTSLPTTKGVIHYGKKGAHIVPSHPD